MSEDHVSNFMGDKARNIMDKLIENAPEPHEEDSEAKQAKPEIDSTILEKTGIGSLYRKPWMGPADPASWHDRFETVLSMCKGGGIIALIGTRGSGKTRLASEIARKLCRCEAKYITALRLFTRIKSVYQKAGDETVESILSEYSKCPLLVIDEVQVRGETRWENDVLTDLVDNRHSNERPTIIIGNLTERALKKSLGKSIVSRMTESGGIFKMIERSYRITANSA